MSIDKTEHNGWTNYATWKVNLELFDGYELTEEKGLIDLEQELRFLALSYIDEAMPDNTLASGWAMAFLQEVDYYMIAKRIIENYQESQ